MSTIHSISPFTMWLMRTISSSLFSRASQLLVPHRIRNRQSCQPRRLYEHDVYVTHTPHISLGSSHDVQRTTSTVLGITTSRMKMRLLSRILPRSISWMRSACTRGRRLISAKVRTSVFGVVLFRQPIDSYPSVNLSTRQPGLLQFDL